MICDMFDGSFPEEKPIEVPESVKKISPFDFLNSINANRPMEFGDEEDTAYVPFLVNRGLSYYADTVMYANMMNERSTLSNHAQYSFLLNTVRKGKRFGKWLKRDVLDNVELVKSSYGYSNKKAMAALSILSTEQISLLKQQNYKGGAKDGSRKKVTD